MGIGTDTLNISAHRILNRIIFLRICEDRSLEEYELLKNIQNYEELKMLFIEADIIRITHMSSVLWIHISLARYMNSFLMNSWWRTVMAQLSRIKILDTLYYKKYNGI